MVEILEWDNWPEKKNPSGNSRESEEWRSPEKPDSKDLNLTPEETFRSNRIQYERWYPVAVTYLSFKKFNKKSCHKTQKDSATKQGFREEIKIKSLLHKKLKEQVMGKLEIT